MREFTKSKSERIVTIVVPSYNEEDFIELVINDIRDFVDKIYVVNDVSTDNTYAIVSNIARQNGV